MVKKVDFSSVVDTISARELFKLLSRTHSSPFLISRKWLLPYCSIIRAFWSCVSTSVSVRIQKEEVFTYILTYNFPRSSVKTANRHMQQHTHAHTLTYKHTYNHTRTQIHTHTHTNTHTNAHTRRYTHII